MPVIFDCFDATVLRLAMDTNMKAALLRQNLENDVCSYPALQELLHMSLLLYPQLISRPGLYYLLIIYVVSNQVGYRIKGTHSFRDEILLNIHSDIEQFYSAMVHFCFFNFSYKI